MMPPRHVLAAIDFSEPSRTALAFAARLAAQSSGQLHVLHVQDPLLTAAAEARGFDLAGDTRHEIEAFVRSVGASGATQHVVAGPAAATVCDIAIREHADVIVIGAHGMSGAEHALFGSVAEGVIRRAATSVLVVPATWTPPDASRHDLIGLGPVVAATDLCTPSIQASAAACRLASLLRTRVELVHVVEPLPVIDRWKAHADEVIAARVPAVNEQVGAVAQSLHAAVPVEVRVETGRLAERLAAAAAPTLTRRPVLVLGRRAETSRSGAPGSTAYRVLMLARVPVLVYLPAAGDERT